MILLNNCKLFILINIYEVNVHKSTTLFYMEPQCIKTLRTWSKCDLNPSNLIGTECFYDAILIRLVFNPITPKMSVRSPAAGSWGHVRTLILSYQQHNTPKDTTEAATTDLHPIFRLLQNMFPRVSFSGVYPKQLQRERGQCFQINTMIDSKNCACLPPLVLNRVSFWRVHTVSATRSAGPFSICPLTLQLDSMG